MTKTEAINFFGGASPLARKLSISPNAIYQWSEKIPSCSQWPIAILSSWELMPDDELIPASLDKDSLKKGVMVADENVSQLLIMANTLSNRGRGDVLQALTTMARHNI